MTEIFSLIGTIPINNDGSPDIGNMNVMKNFEALRKAASMGLVEPTLTVDEVADMKFGVPEHIGTKVLELSGVVSEEEAKKK